MKVVKRLKIAISEDCNRPGDCARCACGRLREICEISISVDCSPIGRLCEICMREIA